MRILFVEDEKYIAEAVASVLKKNNYSVDLAHDGEYGLDCGLSGIYDMIVLDIMLPKMNGIEVLKELRGNGIETPVILLTAKDEPDDKVLGLDSGADDYLAKPFHTGELLARLRALSRRKSALINDGILKIGDIELNPLTLMLSRGPLSESPLVANSSARSSRGLLSETKLTLKEAQLLELLIKRNKSITSKEIIIEKLWGYDADAGDNHVEIHVSLLRKKLHQINSKVSVSTVRGAGYALRAEGKE